MVSDKWRIVRIDTNEGCQVAAFKVVFIININMEHLVSQYMNWTLECFIGQAHDVPTAVTVNVC